MHLAALGKFDFALDLIQLAFGGSIGLMILGAIVVGVILLYIVGKILNMREAKDNAARDD